MTKLDQRSEKLLKTVHPQLASVFVLAERQFRFSWETNYQVRVISGLRTAEEQLKMFQSGKSKTTHSKHMLGLAIDVGIFTPSSDGFEYAVHPRMYQDFHRFMDRAALDIGVIIGWGGYWKMRDYGHYWLADDELAEETVKLLAAPIG